MDLGISGKTGLVTGASIGIGRGIALALAAEGVKLAIVARRGQLLEELAARIAADGHARPLIIECDLMQENARASAQSSPQSPPSRGSAPFPLTSPRQRQLTHALLAQMIARRWGRIISIT